MSKKKKPPQPPICSKCGKVIVRDEVLEAIAIGNKYVHGCGKVLVYGRPKVEDAT